MNPKEKAKELVDKFFKPELSHLLYGVLKYDEAKQCAIIAVEEILEETLPDSGFKYWHDVKTEIENL
jgi:hypothetical protein